MRKEVIKAYKDALKEVDYVMAFGYKHVEDKELKEFDFEICGEYSQVSTFLNNLNDVKKQYKRIEKYRGPNRHFVLNYIIFNKVAQTQRKAYDDMWYAIYRSNIVNTKYVIGKQGIRHSFELYIIKLTRSEKELRYNAIQFMYGDTVCAIEYMRGFNGRSGNSKSYELGKKDHNILNIYFDHYFVEIDTTSDIILARKIRVKGIENVYIK
jgi:hypothetical protein